MTADADGRAEEEVDKALGEVLGYVPDSDEDLTDTIDSMQRLEMLITLEDDLSIPFDEAALVGDWWSSKPGIVSYVRTALAQIVA